MFFLKQKTADEMRISDWSSDGCSSDLERDLLRMARDVRDEIKALPDVLDAQLSGEREELVEVVIDPLRLDSYGLQASSVLDAVSRSNRLIAAGALDTGTGRFPIKVPGLYDGVEDILDQPIKVNGDAVVRIRDVAYVQRGFKDRDGYARLDGAPAIAIEVTKRTGANIIATIADARRVVAEIGRAHV